MLFVAFISLHDELVPYEKEHEYFAYLFEVPIHFLCYSLFYLVWLFSICQRKKKTIKEPDAYLCVHARIRKMGIGWYRRKCPLMAAKILLFTLLED